MAHRRMGQERPDLTTARAKGSSVDELPGLIDREPIADWVKPVHASA